MKISVIILALSLVALTGCKASVPSCDDKEVTGLLREILHKEDMTLLKNAGIATVKSEGNSRICKSLINVGHKDGTIETQIGVVYEINLADNGKEFTVHLRIE